MGEIIIYQLLRNILEIIQIFHEKSYLQFHIALKVLEIAISEKNLKEFNDFIFN